MSSRDGGRGDVDESHVVVLVLLLLLLLLLGVSVDVHGEAAYGGQVGQQEALAPEGAGAASFAGGARVQHVVQAQLAEVLLLGGQVLGLDDPQPQKMLRPAAVVLGKKRSSATSPSQFSSVWATFRLVHVQTRLKL